MNAPDRPIPPANAVYVNFATRRFVREEDTRTFDGVKYLLATPEREAAGEMMDVLRLVLPHLQELREAFQSGDIREIDKLGGTRSNRNVDVEVLVRRALAKAEAREGE